MKKSPERKTVHEFGYGVFVCTFCRRKTPNFCFLTENKCVWCDYEYWENKMKEENT